MGITCFTPDNSKRVKVSFPFVNSPYPDKRSPQSQWTEKSEGKGMVVTMASLSGAASMGLIAGGKRSAGVFSSASVARLPSSRRFNSLLHTSFLSSSSGALSFPSSFSGKILDDFI